MKAVKKKRPNLVRSPVPVKKKKALPPVDTRKWKRIEWCAIGADVSMATISLAGIAKLKSGDIKGAAVAVRWERGEDYIVRMRQAAKAHEIVHDLFSKLKIMPELDEVYFALEEPFPLGMVKQMESNALKQQAQISGAFFGGLLRWGWNHIYEISANSWRKIVADDIAAGISDGFSIHHTKWNSRDFLPLPEGYRANDKTVGKYRAQFWVEKFHPEWDGKWPDLISHSKRGLIPRPEGSNAQGVQSDDRYEAFAMAKWMQNEIERSQSA